MLVELKISDVRNLESLNLTLSKTSNIIVGPNGSGKTSILETIYLLSRARSFRTYTTKKIISSGKNALVVYGLVEDEQQQNKIAIKKSTQETLIKINGEKEKKSSELASYLRVHLIRPESQTLLERGGALRRSFLDWGVFHVKHDFLTLSKNYNKVLKQRNQLLKQSPLDTLPLWNKKLAEYGTILDAERLAYVESLRYEFKLISEELLGLEALELEYNRGWPENRTFLEALEGTKKRDVFKGYTTVGSHRADFNVKVGNCLAQDYLSRGQMKLLVLALYLAQVKVTSMASQQRVVVLIDDLPAELDVYNLKKVVSFLSRLSVQVVMTTTNINNFLGWYSMENTKVFHVKHGCIIEGD